MEALGYAFGAVPFPSAGVGAPHIRDRLYWLADANQEQWGRRADCERLQPNGTAVEWDQGDRIAQSNCSIDRLADPIDGAGHGSQPRGIIRELPQGVGALQTERRQTGPVNGRWSDADWLFCRDGKWRPVEPGTFPLAHGVAGRVGRLRAYGNAIVPQVAAEVIAAFMECRP